MTFLLRPEPNAYVIHSAIGAIAHDQMVVCAEAAASVDRDGFGLHRERCLDAVGRLEKHLAAIKAELAAEPLPHPCRDMFAPVIEALEGAA